MTQTKNLEVTNTSFEPIVSRIIKSRESIALLESSHGLLGFLEEVEAKRRTIFIRVAKIKFKQCYRFPEIQCYVIQDILNTVCDFQTFICVGGFHDRIYFGKIFFGGFQNFRLRY